MQAMLDYNQSVPKSVSDFKECKKIYIICAA